MKYYPTDEITKDFPELEESFRFICGTKKKLDEKERELLEDFIDDVRYGLYIESLEYDENGEPMTREKVVKKMIARFSYKR